MLTTGKKLPRPVATPSKEGEYKLSGFSLIEIIISLAIFSILITTVITITITMIASQKRIQAQLFLSQTGQTTLEAMSRQLRYAYNYSGSTEVDYVGNGEAIKIDSKDLTTTTGASASSSLILINAQNSPFILFESQYGNPNDWSDQNAYCANNGKLYKVTKFGVQTNGITYIATCGDANSSSMLPDSITLENISFDIYAGDSQNPKNPMVRIKMKLKHEDAGELDIQTTVTQRLITYF